MKKIASLFLIAALFYNVLGFYMIFAEQREQVWVAAMEKTEEQNFEVIELTINPYGYIVDSGFENANEEIVVGNKSYHVFKKRIQNNVLKFYCLRNSDKKVFSSDFKKIVDSHLFDTDSNKENSSKKIIKSHIKDFIPNNQNIVLNDNFITHPVTISSYHPQSALLSGYFTLNYPPPNMV
ncbi:hypothetical protein ACLI09_02115 [Flavobacterium sp. RHBU_24]|uniref:hypothetical protein n=1 Tax=Flavobacterium sp. RHBU_24 TaxID=3391185 RepID=UPI003984FD9F